MIPGDFDYATVFVVMGDLDYMALLFPIKLHGTLPTEEQKAMMPKMVIPVMMPVMVPTYALFYDNLLYNRDVLNSHMRLDNHARLRRLFEPSWRLAISKPVSAYRRTAD
jgi:hypothetical protein